MFRFAADMLDEWLQDKNRKPLVLRGARQVGKTWLVGRITYYYLEPMSFSEFVLTSGNEPLYRKLSSYGPGEKISGRLHEKCLGLYHDYCLVGGMPEVAREWRENRNLKSCMKLQHDLLATYRDDFHKYGGKTDARLLARIFLSVSKQLGNKFVRLSLLVQGATFRISWRSGIMGG